ncbi:arsenite S-adenosylmethyltransferase [Endozoicomonas montiporae]|uniref:Arsenite methyltransferase n=2 Tax=Endozoicomonas montiporae TaxID=1027273 RepID=A0A081N5X9_9GAMM|nr:arsenite methyltransferase [Endozoicomonas montiporae]AMO57239.1 methylase involved in ubiquinone/menaquinone biosynthesis [Endozoicomonas montiporae CL-33]KEQ13852.1 arsenite S-adenosylmethyltransferase [Endozoicomonas montiporae]
MSHVVHDKIRKHVRDNYRKVAESKAPDGDRTHCCDSSKPDPDSMSLQMGYSQNDVEQVPEGANMGLGCGNPKAIASLKPGETVLDLGSGGGFDCFLAAAEVGDTGHVIGVDMTPEMVSKARANVEKSVHNHVEFRLGEIEYLPVADATIDVVISNCVINLSPNKLKVFQEVYRVLKPGGRLAISDTVASIELPKSFKSEENYNACLSGAILIEELERIMQESGFTEIKITPKNESKAFIRHWAPGTNVEDYILSAYIEGVKPAH